MTPISTPSAVRPAAAPEPGSGQLRRLSFHAMGTTCEIQYVTGSDRTNDLAFEQQAISWVQAFEAKYSRFRPASLISRINLAAGKEWVAIDADMEQMLTLGDMIHTMTNGLLDPTALPLIQLWNWKVEHPVIPDAATVEETRQLVGWSKVLRAHGKIFLPKAGMALDFGGFGKEYAVDMVAQIALEHGVTNVLVDFGHDLRALGAPPGRPAWHIGLENPHRPGESWASLAISGNQGIASSGDYIRCFKENGLRYGHIIDPQTGAPVRNGCMQATILASSCLQAGVLSTAAFVLGVPRGIEFIQSFPTAEGMLITETAKAQTRGFYKYVAV